MTKKLWRTIAATTAIVVGASILNATAAQPSAQAVTAGSAPILTVSGKDIVDTRTSSTFVPRGVNIPGLEYSCYQGWSKLPATGLQTAAGTRRHIVRFRNRHPLP